MAREKILNKEGIKVEKLDEIADKNLKPDSKLESYKELDNSSDTMKIALERDIALDFATKVYKHLNEIVKSVVMFGSSAKRMSTPQSDIDIIIIIDDVSIKWDLELIAWYREELGKIVKANPYRKSLHINSVKLSTWWQDLMRGDPTVVNIIRYGDPLIDFGGFFSPLKVLLEEGKIKSTPEAVYTLLQRAPNHLARTRTSMLAAIDGLYWCMVDSAHAALISSKIMPPSPEHIYSILRETFVDKGMLKPKYADWYRDLHITAKDIVHGKKIEIKGKEVDEWFSKTDEFLGEMSRIVNESVEKI
jgi:predicted nucleotidyltransferase/uncharacterized protein (UPF0332 family)